MKRCSPAMAYSPSWPDGRCSERLRMQTTDPARRSPTTFKCAPPEETVARLQRGFNRLDLKPSLEQGRAAPDLDLWWVRVRCAGLGLEAAGKGISPILAQASALAELAERFSAGLYCRALRFRVPIERADEAGADEDADPFRRRYERFRCFDALPGYVAARASEIDAGLSLSRLLAPKIVGPAEQQALASHASTAHWIDGVAVADQRPLKVPLGLIELTSGTNGLAAGNSIDEAVIQGTSEVLERYAAVKVITERLRIPTIDPKTLPKIAAIEQFLAYCQSQGIEVLIKDFSLGHGLPCIGMLMIDPRMRDATNPLQTAYAYQRFRVAASPNPIEALTRCVTEEGQSRWRVLQTGDANPYHLLWHRLLKHLPTTATAINDNYPLLRSYEYPGDLSFLREGEQVDFPSPPQTADCRGEIAALSAACAALDSELIVVDHTHPLLRFPTVRVVVPGVSTILCRLDQQDGLGSGAPGGDHRRFLCSGSAILRG